MTTIQVTSKKNEKPFKFVSRHFARADAIDIVDEALRNQDITGIDGSELARRHVNVQSLAQRLVKDDDFDMGQFTALVNSRYGVERLNDVLKSDLSTSDLNTAIHYIAEERGVSEERKAS
jgi:hypothetical protein